MSWGLKDIDCVCVNSQELVQYGGKGLLVPQSTEHILIVVCAATR